MNPLWVFKPQLDHALLHLDPPPSILNKQQLLCPARATPDPRTVTDTATPVLVPTAVYVSLSTTPFILSHSDHDTTLQGNHYCSRVSDSGSSGYHYSNSYVLGRDVTPSELY